MSHGRVFGWVMGLGLAMTGCAHERAEAAASATPETAMNAMNEGPAAPQPPLAETGSPATSPIAVAPAPAPPLTAACIPKCVPLAKVTPPVIENQPEVAAAEPDACTTCGPLRIHFDFNSAEVSADARELLDQSARCLKSKPGMKFAIEGNTDERGAVAYNQDLAQRRADAVAKYLESMGASPSQVTTVSLGATNPLCGGHDESCWEQNRRVVIVPSNLEASVNRPRL